MKKNESLFDREMDDYRSDEELYVYDQSCSNCLYEGTYTCPCHRGWCVDWKERRK